MNIGQMMRQMQDMQAKMAEMQNRLGEVEVTGGAVFKALHDIGSGAQSVSQLGGPIAITKAAVNAGRDGFEADFTSSRTRAKGNPTGIGSLADSILK